METPQRASPLAYLLLFCPPFLWSTNFIVGKALVGSVPPWTLNTGRFVVSALVLSPMLVYRGGWRPLPKESIVPLILMSLTGVFGTNALFYTGLHYTTAINATLVNAMTPVTTAFLAWLFIDEKMSWRRVLGIIISLSGISWIVSRGSFEALLRLTLNPGDLIVFIASALWGFYSVMGKRLMRQIPPFVITALTTILGALFLVPAALVELSFNPTDLWRLEVVLAFLYLGIFPSFLSFLIWNRSVLLFGPGRATLVYNTLPLFAVVQSVIFLGESFMPYQMIGGAVIIAGVVIGTIDKSQIQRP